MNIREFWGLDDFFGSTESSKDPGSGAWDEGKDEVLGALRRLTEAQGNPDLAQQRIAEVAAIAEQFVVPRMVPLIDARRYLAPERKSFKAVLAWLDEQQSVDLGFSLIYSARESSLTESRATRLCGLSILSPPGPVSGHIVNAFAFLRWQAEFCDRYGLVGFYGDYSTYLNLIPAVHPDLVGSWGAIIQMIRSTTND